MASPPCSITKAEVLTSLSRALDIVDGQPPGHAARTCLIASQIAETVGLPQEQRDDVYFVSLIKDAGCSNNAVRVHKMFGGDDLLTKGQIRQFDWAAVEDSLDSSSQEGAHGSRLRRIISDLGGPDKVMDELVLARCSRGAEIAAMLGFSAAVCSAIEALDEHWDGKGAPRKLRGGEIPVEAQIVCLAQTAEVFFTAFGAGAALTMVDARKGAWFCPDLACAFAEVGCDGSFWEMLDRHASEAVRELPVSAALWQAAEEDIDRICEAFGLVVDAKSSFTAQHSVRVTQNAVALGEYFGLDAERMVHLRRGSLLHDLGKVGVSSAILEKPGRLSEEEMAAVRKHARFGWEILSPIRVFQKEAELASSHHERLDGRGYWRGLKAPDLDRETRILSVADVFDALRSPRPYRQAMHLEQVFAVLDSERGTGLCPECVDAMKGLALQQRALAA